MGDYLGGGRGDYLGWGRVDYLEGGSVGDYQEETGAYLPNCPYLGKALFQTSFMPFQAVKTLLWKGNSQNKHFGVFYALPSSALSPFFLGIFPT